MIKCDCCGCEGNKYFLNFRLCNTCHENAIRLRDGDKAAISYFEHIDLSNASIEFKTKISSLLDEKKEETRHEEELQAKKEERERRAAEESVQLREAKRSFLTSTGYNFEGYRIVEYKNVISNECLVGTGLFSDLSSEFNDLFGTESATNKSKLARSKERALDRLKNEAILMGANALIGIDFDIMTFSNNTIVTSVNGTAVVVEKMN